jgi:phosphoketolase
MDALEHFSLGASTWKFATNDGGGEPDVVLACAGDVTTIEICAALMASAETCSRHLGAGCQCSGLEHFDEPG